MPGVCASACDVFGVFVRSAAAVACASVDHQIRAIRWRGDDGVHERVEQAGAIAVCSAGTARECRACDVNGHPIIALQCLVKISARGKQPLTYFHDNWNTFDFLVVLLVFLPLQDVFDFTLLRVIRLLRVLKLVNALPELNILVSSLFRSVGAIASVMALLFLLFFVYR